MLTTNTQGEVALERLTPAGRVIVQVYTVIIFPRSFICIKCDQAFQLCCGDKTNAARR